MSVKGWLLYGSEIVLRLLVAVVGGYMLVGFCVSLLTMYFSSPTIDVVLLSGFLSYTVYTLVIVILFSIKSLFSVTSILLVVIFIYFGFLR